MLAVASPRFRGSPACGSDARGGSFRSADENRDRSYRADPIRSCIQPIKRNYRYCRKKRLPQGYAFIHNRAIVGRTPTEIYLGLSMPIRRKLHNQIGRCAVYGETTDHHSPMLLLQNSNKTLGLHEFLRRTRSLLVLRRLCNTEGLASE
jgi:hypothetical protein